MKEGQLEFINQMVELQKSAYDSGMRDAVNTIIEVINTMQRQRGLQVMTIDEIRRVLNDGLLAIK